MSYENILFETEGAVATVTFNRPKVLNALNHATLVELRDALDRARDDEAVRCVVLTGAGEKAFVAGADINELAAMQPMGAKDLAFFGQETLQRLERMGKPTVAMVNGFALGGGLELARFRRGEPAVRGGVAERLRNGLQRRKRASRRVGSAKSREIPRTFAVLLRGPAVESRREKSLERKRVRHGIPQRAERNLLAEHGVDGER